MGLSRGPGQESRAVVIIADKFCGTKGRCLPKGDLEAVITLPVTLWRARHLSGLTAIGRSGKMMAKGVERTSKARKVLP